MFDITELEEVEWPKDTFEPYKFIEKGRAECAYKVARALPPKFVEAARQELAVKGIHDEEAIVLKAVSLMKSFINRITKDIPPDLYKEVRQSLNDEGLYDDRLIMSVLTTPTTYVVGFKGAGGSGSAHFSKTYTLADTI